MATPDKDQPDETDCGGGKGEGALLIPNVSSEQATSLIRRVYGYEDVVCLRGFPSYVNQNLLVEVRHPSTSGGDVAVEKYVLKLLNSDESRLFDCYAGQNRILHYLNDEGIACPRPVMNLQGDDISRESLTFTQKSGEEVSGSFLIRLLKYLPGDPIGTVDRLTAKMCFEDGRSLGKLTRVLQEYRRDKSVFVERDETYEWSLSNLPVIRSYLHHVKDIINRNMVEEIVTAFETRVLGNVKKLRKGYIHGDFNDYNVLVRQIRTSHAIRQSHESASEHEIAGILDFDDVMYSCIVYDVAIAIMYVMQCCNLERSPLDSGGIFLAGYLTEWTLDTAEREALYYCIAGRFAQSLLLGLYSYSQDPQNDYLLSTQVKGWQVTRELWGQEVKALYSHWQELSDKYKNHFKEQ